jgi:hypothetical protein
MNEAQIPLVGPAEVSLYVSAPTYPELLAKVEAALGGPLNLNRTTEQGKQSADKPAEQKDAAPATAAVELATPTPRRARARTEAATSPNTVSPAPAASTAPAVAEQTPPAPPSGAAAQPAGAVSSPPTAPVSTLTVDDCRKAMAAVNDKHGMQAVVDLLARFGAARASMLKPEQFDQFVKQAEAEAARAAAAMG